MHFSLWWLNAFTWPSGLFFTYRVMLRHYRSAYDEYLYNRELMFRKLAHKGIVPPAPPLIPENELHDPLARLIK